MYSKCNIVKDLLPLYIEGLASKDSKEFIESHIAECDSCRRELSMLNKDDAQKQFSNISVPNDNRQIKNFRKKLIKTITGYWWLFLFLIMISTVIFIVGSGYISGSNLKRELDGKIFCNVKSIEYEGQSIYVRQIKFSGRDVDIKTIVIDSKDWDKGEIEYAKIGDGERYYSAYKDLPGRRGTYHLSWTQGIPFVRQGADVVFSDNGEIIGLQQGSTFYYSIEQVLLPD